MMAHAAVGTRTRSRVRGVGGVGGFMSSRSRVGRCLRAARCGGRNDAQVPLAPGADGFECEIERC
jgi:hypothetical protein